MKEKDLQIDRSCHVVYSRQCKKIIMDRIRRHYEAENADAVFEQVQHRYEKYLSEYSRKDLGGKKNRSNGIGGTYDCIMIVCYYVVCKEKTSFSEIQKMTQEVTVGSFRGLGFVDIEKPFFKRLRIYTEQIKENQHLSRASALLFSGFYIDPPAG